MNLNGDLSNDQLLQVVGERLTKLRLGRSLTQEQLAEEAGLGLRTIQRMESGGTSTRLDGFLRVCRVLGVLDRLELLLPDPGPSPIDQLKLQGKVRRRVRHRKPKPGDKPEWTWGEES